MNRYSCFVAWSPEDREYVALSTEFPALSGMADTPEGAMASLRAAIAAALDAFAEDGEPVPEPHTLGAGEGPHLPDGIRPAYDFSPAAGVRGKYAARYDEGTNVALLDPDLAKLFPDSEAVNRALRSLVEIAQRAGPGRSAS